MGTSEHLAQAAWCNIRQERVKEAEKLGLEFSLGNSLGSGKSQHWKDWTGFTSQK